MIATLKSLRSKISVNEKMLEKKLWKFEVAEYTVLLMVLIYSVIFSYYTIMRHYSFRSYAWDLGLLTQSITSATKGKLFVNNVEPYFSPSGSYFGVHFSPILFTIIPFFALAPNVETVLILQSIVLGLGAVPTYLISKRCLNRTSIALFLSAAYLLNPLLQSVNWYDFHPQAFFPVLILSATYFLKERKAIPFLLLIILTLMTMEQASYLVVLYMVYVAREMKKEVKELITVKKITLHSILPFVAFAIVILWIIISSYAIHSINPNPPPELKALDAYKALQINDPTEIPIKAITNPDLALKAIRFDLPKKTFYLTLTFVPSGFLALFEPVAVLPALLWLFLAMLSNHAPYYQLGFQYTAFTLPFLTIATIEALQKLTESINEENRRKIRFKMSAQILVIGLIISIFVSPLSLLQRPGEFTYFRDYGISMPSSLDNKIMETLRIMPSDALVITTPTIFPHLSTNLNAYVLPSIGPLPPRLYAENLKYLKSLKYDYVFFTYYFDKTESDRMYYEFVNGTKTYGLFVYGPGLELYKLGYRNAPSNIAVRFSYKELFLGDYSFTVEDPSSESGTVIMLKASPNVTEIGTLWFGPYITLEPGKYTANFRMKIDHLWDGKAIKLDVWTKSLSASEIESSDVYGNDFSQPLTWQTFTITFTITKRTADVEFRGMEPANNQTIWFDYVEVIPN